MSQPWPMLPLAKVLRPISRPEPVDPEKTYRILGAHWYAAGLYIKDIRAGAQIRADRMYRVERGDFVYNRLFAWKGSFALATADSHGCYVSNEFPCFEIDSDRLDGRYLWRYFSQAAIGAEALGLSKGGTPTSRNRLKEENLLAMQLPLPPLEEQRRIVARVDELAAKIEEARGLRRQAIEATGQILAGALSEILDNGAWETQRLGSLLAEPPRNGLSPQPEVAGGRPMLRINAVSSSPTRFVDTSQYKAVDISDAVAEPFTLCPDDVLIVRYNGDINRVGKAAMFKAAGACDAVYPDKLMRLRPHRDQMTPDFLVYALSSRTVRAQIEELGKTTAGQIGISGSNARSFCLAVPPLPEQRRIVAYLDSLQARVDALKRLQAETAAELDALLPAVLDKAFKGEL